ncbi:hypothetical protein CDAR_218811 [Caerostris darwini]|uniref:Uncharacterized protein n=1 Tax=Caerostris darwini TaxID=1538125 RepID=A0AAV4UGU2_9ARAC|nr:hypothetical protein CDAR_218811 [Caerostris darwini]
MRYNSLLSMANDESQSATKIRNKKKKTHDRVKFNALIAITYKGIRHFPFPCRNLMRIGNRRCDARALERKRYLLCQSEPFCYPRNFGGHKSRFIS